jgi:hypothetical protein
MAPLFAASHASLIPLFSPDPAAARRVRGTLSSRSSGLRLRGAPRAAGRGRGRGRGSGGIPDEWGDRSPPGAPEPPARPEPPVEEDEWGGDAAEGSSRPIVVDEWGEAAEPETEPEPEPPSAADPPSPAADDEWEEPAAPAPAPAEEEVDEQAEKKRREDLKRCLVDTVYGSELGFRASSEVRGEVVELVTQLEAVNPTSAPVEAPDLLDGNWILM